MRQLQFYVDDDRCSVPNLTFEAVTDVLQAFVIAGRLIDQSGHHRGVEVCEDGKRLFGLGSCAQPPKADAVLAAQEG